MRSYNYVTCTCGKRGFFTRKTARRELHAGDLKGLGVYCCTESGLWHWGHLPPAVKDGRWAREDLGTPARRSPTATT